jgi:uncharacterized membrane protein YesL
MFSPDGSIYKTMSTLFDILVIGIVWFLACLPLVTIGASLAALHSVNLRSLRYGDGYVAGQYFKAFRESFCQATLCWIGLVITGGLLLFDYRFWMALDYGFLSKFQIVVCLVIAIVLGIFAVWLFPVLAKMKGSLKEQAANAMKMAIGYFFPHTVCVVGIAAFAGWAAYVNTDALLIMAVFGIALVSYLQSFFFYKVFAKHIDEEPIGEDDPIYGDRRNQKVM